MSVWWYIYIYIYVSLLVFENDWFGKVQDGWIKMIYFQGNQSINS